MQATLVKPEEPEDEPVQCGKYSLVFPVFLCLVLRKCKESLSQDREGEHFLFPLLLKAKDDALFFREVRSCARNYAAIRQYIMCAGNLCKINPMGHP